MVELESAKTPFIFQYWGNISRLISHIHIQCISSVIQSRAKLQVPAVLDELVTVIQTTTHFKRIAHTPVSMRDVKPNMDTNMSSGVNQGSWQENVVIHLHSTSHVQLISRTFIYKLLRNKHTDIPAVAFFC